MSVPFVLGTRSPGNKSANTDPQLQEAAPPQGLWSGYLQRYLATSRMKVMSPGAVIAARLPAMAFALLRFSGGPSCRSGGLNWKDT
jgi:hypothetical protein